MVTVSELVYEFRPLSPGATTTIPVERGAQIRSELRRIEGPDFAARHGRGASVVVSGHGDAGESRFYEHLLELSDTPVLQPKELQFAGD